MCYNFICDFDNDVISTIEEAIGTADFFIFSAGYLNYFYTNKKENVYRLRNILIDKRILLHTVAEKDMRLLLKSFHANTQYNFKGNRSLLERFMDGAEDYNLS